MEAGAWQPSNFQEQQTHEDNNETDAFNSHKGISRWL
jgi:hypothetical protein